MRSVALKLIRISTSPPRWPIWLRSLSIPARQMSFILHTAIARYALRFVRFEPANVCAMITISTTTTLMMVATVKTTQSNASRNSGIIGVSTANAINVVCLAKFHHMLKWHAIQHYILFQNITVTLITVHQR